MFAIVLFASFGLMVAVVAGIVTNFHDNIQLLNTKLIDEQQKKLQEIRTVFNYSTQLNLDIKNIAAYTTPSAWLCGDTGAVASKAAVSCRDGIALDAWFRPLEGVMVRETGVGMFAPPRMAATAPVVAIALISRGPNGVLDTPLPVSPTTLAAISTNINIGGDDIGIVFTNQRTQEESWRKMVATLQQVGQAVSNYYADRAKVFQQSLGGIYAGGTLSLSEADQNAWKNYAGAPNFTEIMLPVGSLTGSLNIDLIGSSQEVSDIQREILHANTVDTGQFIINTQVASSNITGSNNERDTFYLWLTNQNTAWVIGAPNCNITSPMNCLTIKGAY